MKSFKREFLILTSYSKQEYGIKVQIYRKAEKWTKQMEQLSSTPNEINTFATIRYRFGCWLHCQSVSNYCILLFFVCFEQISVCGSKKVRCFGTIKKYLRNFCARFKFRLSRKLFYSKHFRHFYFQEIEKNCRLWFWPIKFLNVFKFGNDKLRLCKYLDVPMGLNLLCNCTEAKCINSMNKRT